MMNRNRKTKYSNDRAFNERDRLNFPLPSSKLFRDFCQDLIGRFTINDMVTTGRVQNVEPIVSTAGSTGFHVTVQLDQNSGSKSFTVRRVIACIGPMNIPRIPEWVSVVPSTINDHHLLHSKDLLATLQTGMREKIPKSVLMKKKLGQKTHLVIVGGGLTSAHLACKAAHDIGYSKVYHEKIMYCYCFIVSRQFHTLHTNKSWHTWLLQ